MKGMYAALKDKLRKALILYDSFIFIISAAIVLTMVPAGKGWAEFSHVAPSMLVSLALLCVVRGVGRVYEQIWRFAKAPEYMLLINMDVLAATASVLLCRLLPASLSVERHLYLHLLNLMLCMVMRLLYQWIYQKRNSERREERIALRLLKRVTGIAFSSDQSDNAKRIRVAIVGAGGIGSMLVQELQQNAKSIYKPVCFVDADKDKAGRVISGVPVLRGEEGIQEKLDAMDVHEIIFAMGSITQERRSELFRLYESMGYKIMVYDYPLQAPHEDKKRVLHELRIEDLLFRMGNDFLNAETKAWYSGKCVLITGGGGSIGSELARQITQCNPKTLVLLDVYENGVYDIQQELKMRFGDRPLDLRIEIATICDREEIDRIFDHYRPDIVLHAAAHKHVPLMENNAFEAVSNNVFGTLNVVNACEKYKVKRFIMVSTDKAVNPTNVMGATKRMCEMIVQSRSGSETSFSATRFGNVLGSNGSVIPLFKRQIANGGPITITDKRIIRYFMTIPEASQLVMTSGAMAKNGELYVLNMGKPVRILELAENMIRLSGLEPYKDIDIIEIGLRPGEKLYEELLIKTEELDKTENDMIFVERDKPLSKEEIEEKLEVLRKALATRSNRAVKKALMNVVPTYHTPEEVNERAIEAEEMRIVAGA